MKTLLSVIVLAAGVLAVLVVISQGRCMEQAGHTGQEIRERLRFCVGL